MDRWREGYNDCDVEWRRKIQKEIEELKNIKIEGETFATAVNYAVLQLQDLLKRG